MNKGRHKENGIWPDCLSRTRRSPGDNRPTIVSYAQGACILPARCWAMQIDCPDGQMPFKGIYTWCTVTCSRLLNQDNLLAQVSPRHGQSTTNLERLTCLSPPPTLSMADANLGKSCLAPAGLARCASRAHTMNGLQELDPGQSCEKMVWGVSLCRTWLSKSVNVTATGVVVRERQGSPFV